MIENEGQNYEILHQICNTLRGYLQTWDGLYGFLETKKYSVPALIEQAGVKDLYSALNKAQQQAVRVALNGALAFIQKKRNDLLNENRPDLIDGQMDIICGLLYGVTQEDMMHAYKALCEYDFIYDILNEDLHRLDPVIGDLGCQWRTPFVLDAYNYLIVAAINECGTEQQLKEILQSYRQNRDALPSCSEILLLCQETGTVTATKKIPPVYKSYEVRQLYTHITMFVDKQSQDTPFHNLTVALKANLEQWLTQEIDDFNAYEYLFLCKLLTTNRIRTFDSCGLSGVPSTLELPNSKAELSDFLVKLSSYSIKYVTYMMEQTCLNIGLKINDDGFAYWPDGSTDIHIAGSALSLMKYEKFWTFQNATFYQTHVCYGPLRSLLAYQHTNGHPIIIDVRRLICHPQGNDEYSYSYNGGKILYFEPVKGGLYRYISNPNDEQRRKVSMCCEAYSMVMEGEQFTFDDPDRILATLDFEEYIKAITEHYSIIDLILSGLVSHDELPTQIQYQKGVRKEIPHSELDQMVMNQYLQATGLTSPPGLPGVPWCMYDNPLPFEQARTPQWNLLLEKQMLWSVIGKFNLQNAKYKNITDKKNRDRALRTTGTVPFGPIHIYGCTYQRKVMELETIDMSIDRGTKHPRLIVDSECKRRPE